MRFERAAWALVLVGALASGGCDLDTLDDILRGRARRDAPPAEPAPVDQAPYPIVLAHGFFGFEAFAGVDYIDYFFGVRAHLAEAGELQVFTPAVDPFNDSVTRGRQLQRAVEDIVKRTGVARVNLVGHSQGGLDARYVAHHRPDLVASVTTIGTPHRGTPLADLALGLSDFGPVPGLLDALTRLIGAPLWDAVGNETSVMAALYQLSEEGAAEYNATITDAPGVPYYSIGGRTAYASGGRDCAADDAPEFITRWGRARDPVDPLLLLTGEVLAGGLFNRSVNDGLVPASSTHWGRFLGCIPADHLDQMGQLLGDLPGLLNPFRHRTFYRDLVSWLRAEGL